jgi:hypothetical protein
LKGRVLFPIGLYASLFVALLCLFNARLTAPVESWGAALMSLPLRALGVLWPEPAMAASSLEEEGESLRQLAELRRRQMRRHAQIPSALRGRQGLQPVLCQVVERLRPGAAEWPSVLILDRSWSELRGMSRYVTHGDSLLGFLAAPEPGESPQAPARVELLHYRERGRLPRRVAAAVDLGDSGSLRFLVEPAAILDTRAPLRCALPDDSYLAATVGRDDLEAFTVAAEDPLGAVPAGLRIGRMSPWGYSTGEGRFVSIGLFIEPEANPQFLSLVNLWTRSQARATGPRAPLREDRLWPVHLTRLPLSAEGAERWFVSHRWDAPTFRAGSALVVGSRLVGRISSAGPGHAFVRPFGQVGESWAVTLLPAMEDFDPVDLSVVCVGRDRERSRLRILDGASPSRRGELFSGTMSEDCPAGLWIGPVEPAERADEFYVHHYQPAAGQGLSIFHRGEAGR